MVFLEENYKWIFLILIVLVLIAIGYMAEKGGLLKNKRKGSKTIRPSDDRDELLKQLEKEKLMDQLLRELKEKEENQKKDLIEKKLNDINVDNEVSQEELKRTYDINKKDDQLEKQQHLDEKEEKKQEHDSDVEMNLPDLDEINTEISEEDDTWQF